MSASPSEPAAKEPASHIPVSVAYALPEQQWVVELTLPEPARVSDALAAVAAQAPFDQLALEQIPLGVWGVPATRSQRLKAHDRLELYRPLEVDPKTARVQRAQDQLSGSSGSGRAEAGR